MKILSAILALTAALIAAPLASFAADHHRKIAVQTYTFRNFTLEKTTLASPTRGFLIPITFSIYIEPITAN